MRNRVHRQPVKPEPQPVVAPKDDKQLDALHKRVAELTTHVEELKGIIRQNKARDDREWEFKVARDRFGRIEQVVAHKLEEEGTLI